MTTFAPSGKPAWAVPMWMDDNAIYMELPCTDGPPFITKYSLCDAGLSKALGMMRDIHRKQEPAGGSHSFAQHPKVKTGKGDFSEAQRANARNVLKRLKII